MRIPRTSGTSPITRASGKKRIVLARYARNRRMADALQQWAFCSLRGSPGARAYYDIMRARNIGHQAALRQLSNRLVGIHARLSENQNGLQRTDRLEPPHHSRSLTFQNPGMFAAIRGKHQPAKRLPSRRPVRGIESAP